MKTMTVSQLEELSRKLAAIAKPEALPLGELYETPDSAFTITVTPSKEALVSAQPPDLQRIQTTTRKYAKEIKSLLQLVYESAQ